MRQAERAAEREALLTGQQPVLTRRELRRLREEAEALQAAIEAGEITLEQAKALQDPLAEAPHIDVPVLHASGAHAVAAPAAAAGDGQDAGSGPAGEALAEEERRRRERLAQAATGVLEPVDAPEPPEQQRTPVAPAVAPSRHSLRERLAGEQQGAPAVPGPAQGAGEPGAAAVVPSAAGSAGRPEPAGRAERARHTHHAADAPATAAPVPRSEGAHAAAGGEDPRDGAGAAAPAGPVTGQVPVARTTSGPTRRPIVRIPATAQGVRTVDAHTGELSAVRPADEDLEPIETPQWRALRADAVVRPAASPAAASSPVEHAATGQQAAVQPDASEEPSGPVDSGREQGRRWSSYLLWALLVLVIILVVSTLVWFYLGRSASAEALAAAGVALPLLGADLPSPAAGADLNVNGDLL